MTRRGVRGAASGPSVPRDVPAKDGRAGGAAAPTPQAANRCVKAGYRPARGYSWPPFEPGNSAAQRHGVYSRRVIAERAQELLDELLERCPSLCEEADATALETYCQAQAKANMLNRYIWAVVEGRVRSARRGGAPRTGIEGVPPRTWCDASRAEANAQKFAAGLGLTPAGFAAIAKDVQEARRLLGRDAA